MSKEEILLIIYVVAVLLGFSVFTFFFVSVFQKRKNKFLIDKIKTQQRFTREIEVSRLEIQEQTLKNVAWELHDNIGQLLSLTNMQLNILLQKIPEEHKQSLQEASHSIKQTVAEVRLLSKALNNDVILKNGLITSFENDLSRFERMKYLTTTLDITGNPTPFDSNKEILIFRIFQEFCTNVFKHAKANELKVHVSYGKEAMTLEVKDDGVGFDDAVKTTSNGLETMKGRAHLLNAAFSITSIIGKGTTLFLKSPYIDDIK